jgi:hypothetical protein
MVFSCPVARFAKLSFMAASYDRGESGAASTRERVSKTSRDRRRAQRLMYIPSY